MVGIGPVRLARAPGLAPAIRGPAIQGHAIGYRSMPASSVPR